METKVFCNRCALGKTNIDDSYTEQMQLPNGKTVNLYACVECVQSGKVSKTTKKIYKNVD